MKVWTYLERVPPSMHGAWPADSARVAHRAHFLEETRPGFILVEFISGEQAEWPLAECRELGAGATQSVPPPTEKQSDSLGDPMYKIGAPTVN